MYLEENSLLGSTVANSGEKSAPTMDCIWTVWIKGETETTYMPLLKGSK